MIHPSRSGAHAPCKAQPPTLWISMFRSKGMRWRKKVTLQGCRHDRRAPEAEAEVHSSCTHTRQAVGASLFVLRL